MTLAEASAFQHRLIDGLMSQVSGTDLVQLGDLGYGASAMGRPDATAAVEGAIADAFGAEAAALVWGAGTGAVRSMLTAAMRPGQLLLIHSAPAYNTTRISLEYLSLRVAEVDFNDPEAVSRSLASGADGLLLQHSPQRLGDSYDLASLVLLARQMAPSIQILVDDNYTACRVRRIGVGMGADASAFSCFKLLGPPGVGCLVGRASIVREAWEQNSSGGSKVQGYLAREVIESLVIAPLVLAGEAEVVDSVVRAVRDRLDDYPGLASIEAADVNERAVLVRLERPLAQEVVRAAVARGAAPFPIGGESRHELLPLFYRLAKTFVRDDPRVLDQIFRVNPQRAGADTICRLLRAALTDAFQGTGSPGWGKR